MSRSCVNGGVCMETAGRSQVKTEGAELCV
jgi:hypothetical protein